MLTSTKVRMNGYSLSLQSLKTLIVTSRVSVDRHLNTEYFIMTFVFACCRSL